MPVKAWIEREKDSNPSVWDSIESPLQYEFLYKFEIENDEKYLFELNDDE